MKWNNEMNTFCKKILFALLAVTVFGGFAPVYASSTGQEFSWEPLITRLTADGFDKEHVQTAFAALNSPPLPEFMVQKTIELYGGKASLAVSEAEKMQFAPPDYSRIAGGMTVAAGRRVMNNNAKFFEGLYKRYGVSAPFIIAVLMVETGIGTETGRQSALLALGSIATTNELKDVLPVLNGITDNTETLNERLTARSEWAYSELKALLTYAKESGKDVSVIPGFVYGAIGMCQFMPSNIPLFGASTSSKRPVPDLFILSDAAASVARYISAHGWKKALTPQAQIAVLRSYNHSDVYASTVCGVATSIIAPTTHASAHSARKGGNAVTAARENAKASIPKGKNAKPMENLPDYSKLLE
jgi:membrane-bound lytic murein transglycosylase B